MKNKPTIKKAAPKTIPKQAPAKSLSRFSNPAVDKSKLGQSKMSIQPQPTQNEAQELIDRMNLRNQR